MPNNRIFYAIHAVGIAELGSNSFVALHGVQSVTMNTTFNLEQVFELGQIQIYENIENLPDIEMTIEKVFDGYPPVYLLATKGAGSASLSGRSNIRCSVALSVYSDSQDASSGTPIAQCTNSGLYVNQYNVTFPVQGNATESVSFVGNNKVWTTGQIAFTFTPAFDGLDSPIAIAGSGGVNRREDVLMGSSASLWPTEIPGISSSGTNELVNGVFQAHIGDVRISTSLGREEMFELGRRGPYHRFANFPVEVRTDIDVIASYGDNIDADEASEANITDQAIKVVLREGSVFDLGTKNKLQSANYTGGNAGQNGGNVTCQYSYINYNDLTVTHPADPTEALRP